MDKHHQVESLTNQYRAVRQDFIDSDEFDPIQGTEPILYDGNLNAKIMVVARDLGKDEVEQGKPLIGRAGALFRACMANVGLSLNDVILTNTVPYKPTNNIAFSEYVRGCFAGCFRSLVQLVGPDIFITLGKEATEAVIGNGFGSVLKLVEGTKQTKDLWFYNVTGKDSGAWVCVCAHPSYLLRMGASGKKMDNEYLKRYMLTPLRVAKELMAVS